MLDSCALMEENLPAAVAEGAPQDQLRSRARFGADDVEEELVDAAVFRELGVEGRGENAAGANEDGIVVAAGEDLDAGTEARDARRADEDHLHGPAEERGFGLEDDGVVLAAVGVALDVDVEHAEAGLRRMVNLFGQKDAAGAGAEDGLRADENFEDVVEACAFEVLEEGGGFAARDDERVESGEFFRLADEVRGGAELGEALGVHVEGALQSQHADSGRVMTHCFLSVSSVDAGRTKVLLPSVNGDAYGFARERNHKC
jgi:hypothetical protein